MHPLYQQRRAGVLLHPTSLPGPLPRGQICHDAYRFVEFLHQAGISVWQMLPLGPTHADRSPYLALSVHAGDPALISLDWLRDRGLLPDDEKITDFEQHRQQLLRAKNAFAESRATELKREYADFVEQQRDWLDEFCLFMAIREQQHNRPWTRWPAALRDHRPEALAQTQRDLAEAIEYHRFSQFVFYRQWQDLKTYAARHDVLLFGDMPIYVSLDSADVWANRELFSVDTRGRPEQVAGVPPDYFSKTGQYWGNPLYRWDILEQDHFRWWQRRLRIQLDLFDLVRIDHFRGLQAYWSIPADAKTAMEGHWIEAPGEALLKTLQQKFDNLPLVAEDLGYITSEVHALRRQFDLPGMKILQFAFDGDPGNGYLPHHHEFKSVAYTGTHDNDTTLGWFRNLDHNTRKHVCEYLDIGSDNDMPWPLIRAALASVSCLAVIPMQDLLGLDSAYRMNTPGSKKGNWQWRFDWEQLPENLTSKLQQQLRLYDRLSS